MVMRWPLALRGQMAPKTKSERMYRDLMGAEWNSAL